MFSGCHNKIGNREKRPLFTVSSHSIDGTWVSFTEHFQVIVLLRNHTEAPENLQLVNVIFGLIRSNKVVLSWSCSGIVS